MTQHISIYEEGSLGRNSQPIFLRLRDDTEESFMNVGCIEAITIGENNILVLLRTNYEKGLRESFPSTKQNLDAIRKTFSTEYFDES